MQTFLPLPSFIDSARCLDWRRLGKQRAEAKQILSTLLGMSSGWLHHPVMRMWCGYELALAEYGLVVCREWSNRGYQDVTSYFFLEVMETKILQGEVMEYPPWLGDEAFHLSHRSNLVRKLPEHYQLLWPDCPNNLPYVWPGKV